MSQRAKRPNRSDDGTVPTKRRKCRPSSTAEEEDASSLAPQPATSGPWQPRPINDLKISSIYNRSATEAPAELFRKDLISAMKLPDSEPLAADEYWVITDQWKQEWERGVQVPVNPDSLPEPSVTVTQCAGVTMGSCTGKVQPEFKLPKNKYIRITKDEQFNSEEHILSVTPAKAEAACSYDLDDVDVAWLHLLNGERAQAGLGSITEDQLERVLEQLEVHCWDRIQTIMKNEEGLGIEYDENVICDVCRSPDSEEGNEMVFCDSCNICVHQACYGITTIPAGQWLCCTCSLGQRPDCVLCPNKGGAMKCTRSGQKWAHVSCALWIPEVSIGCVERMEPITKISSIPQSRWALICVLCRERVGACIQCSVKTCKTAYHVTCAFKHGLEMRAIIEDENADDGVKLRSYCQKHSVSSKKEKSVSSGSEDDDSKRKKRKDMTSEEKNQARAARLQEIEAEFDKHVSVKDVMQLEVDNEGLQYIYNYWKLKRRAGHNKPLLPPKSEDVDMLSHKQEQADLEKMKMFVQLRQDLERVRNLCYMVSRREKLSRSFFRMREQTFHKQASVLQSAGHNMTAAAVAAVIEANHGPSIYDRLYSHHKAEDHTADFETVLARIAGLKSPTHDSADEKKPDVNGIVKDRKSLNNPYKRFYFNGSSKRRSGSLYGSSMTSASSSDERKPEIHHSSTENEKVSSSTVKKKAQRVRKTSENAKAAERRRNRLSSMSSRLKVESSSEEDIKPNKKEWSQWPRSRTLRQMEREMGEKVVSATDSDEFMPVRLSKPSDTKLSTTIYSDSDSSESSTKNEDKSSNAASDSQQNRLRTKAAMKEFSLQMKSSAGTSPKGSTSAKKKPEEEETPSPKKDPQIPKSNKKKDYVPSELIVPQRQAAKKASENLKSNTSRSKEVVNTSATNEQEQKPAPTVEEKPKVKVKPKVNKENKELKEKDVKKDIKDHKSVNDVFDIDKEFEKEDNQEILAYVPQRQAAKKAAEHIKSGLVKPIVPESTDADSSKTKKDAEAAKPTKQPHKDTGPESSTVGKGKKNVEPAAVEHDKPNRISENKRKSSTNSTSSSSSSSSSTSSSTSSSDSDDDSPPAPAKKSQPEKPMPLSESLFNSPAIEKRNNSKDWPFLDKAPKSSAVIPTSSSSSDSSDSPADKPPQPKKPITNRTKNDTTKPAPTAAAKTAARAKTKSCETTTDKSIDNSSNKLGGKKFRKVADKKLKTSDMRSEPEVQPAVTEREEPPRHKPRSRAKKPQGYASDRQRDANVGLGDLPDCKRGSVERKPTASASTTSPGRAVSCGDKKEQSSRKRKSDEVGRDADASGEQPRGEAGASATRNKPSEKESVKSRQLSSPLRKADKKLNERTPEKLSSPSQTCNLEKEIMERKAGRESNSKKTIRGTLEKLFEKRDKKMDKQLSAVPVKENKEPSLLSETKHDTPVTKSPSKHKTVNEDSGFPKLNSSDSEPIQNTSEKHKKKSSPRYKKPESYVDLKHRNTEVKPDTFSPRKLDIEHQSDKHKSKDLLITDTLAEKHIEEPPTINTNKYAPDTIINNAVESIKKSPEKLPPSYINRSIFSPQPTPAKDNACSEIFDFDNDMLNVDESANDDGFSIPRDSDEAMRSQPLTFQFANNDFLFKEDSKEDSARETLNLVEKLRMGMKKSTTGQADGTEDMVTESHKDESECKDDVKPVHHPEKELEPPVITIEEEDEKIEDIPEVSNVPRELDVRIEQMIEPEPEHQQAEQLSPTPIQEQEEQRVAPYMEPNMEQNYHYSSCEAEMHLEINKNIIPIQEQHHIDHSSITQADERWVPPSENFPLDIPQHVPADKLYSDSHIQLELNKQPFMPPPELHDQINPSLPKHDLIMPEDIHKNPSPVIQERLPQHTPFLEPASMDCMPSPSPYAEMHQQAKWADSEVLPIRRSSSSSAASSSSSCEHRNEDVEITKRDEMMLQNHPGILSDLAFGMLPQGMTPFPPNTLADALPFHPYSEASQFVTGPVSLFNTQLPFPSPGGAMFPPSYGAPFPAPHSMQKPADDSLHFPTTCTPTANAAFTSSQHNMALTAALVSLPPPTPKALETPTEEEEIPMTPQAPFPIQNEDIPQSPAAVSISSTPVTNHASPASSTDTKSMSNASMTPVGKKSPSKPTRTSARVVSQQSKSPSKSPGKSPRQEPGKTGSGRGRGEGGKRGSGKVVSRGSYSQTRGRGRGRGRGRVNHMQHPDLEYLGSNTIHNKLVGTVYDLDFDDDIANDNMGDLRAMRERRRSTDVHDKKEGSYFSRDSSQSPKFTSPSHGKVRSSFSTDLRDLRPPTPISDMTGLSKSISSPLSMSTVEEPRTYPDIAQPVLPGPVDMRTYNTAFDTQPNTGDYSNQILGAFASSQTEQQLHDIDEDFEKSLHAALTARKTPEVPEIKESDTVKVSLSDSRNQLKVKIKGPFLDANYTSTVAPLPPQSNVPLDPMDGSAMSAATSVNSVMSASVTASSGTSNLRRMRKKELLRQYWTQDMNMDEPASGTVSGQATAPTTTPQVSRTIITIPKAVASMTSIPTREDYKAVVDANMEKKRRKEKTSSGGLVRELRHLDMPLEETGADGGTVAERRRSIGSTGSNVSYDGAYKRKGRPPRPTQQPMAPKLKIKIGNMAMGDSTITSIDDKKFKGRPPKKRLASIPMPSVEDLKRESMKYRRMVMADFDEEKKKRSKSKGERSGKKKKRKSKHEVQIISNDNANTPKLIIRFGKKKDDNTNSASASAGDKDTTVDAGLGVDVEGKPAAEPGPRTEQATDGRTAAPPCPAGPGPPPPATGAAALRKVRSAKLTPIRLKFARCTQGSGYVMKSSEAPDVDMEVEDAKEQVLKASRIASPGPPPNKPPPAPTLETTSLSTSADTVPPLPPPACAAPPLPLNKDCEVR